MNERERERESERESERERVCMSVCVRGMDGVKEKKGERKRQQS